MHYFKKLYVLALVFALVAATDTSAQCPDPTTSGGSVTCYGSVALTASGSTGIYAWYDQAVGGNLLDTGAVFNTPNLFTTTNFYATAFDDATSNALSFDGTNDNVAIQGFNYNGTGITTMTVEAWVRTTSTGNQMIASYDRSEYWRLEINGTAAGPGQIGFGVNTDGGIFDFSSVTRIDDGNWHHVAVVFNTGTVSIFIDGNLDATGSNGTSFGSTNTRFGFLGVGSETAVFDGATGPNNYMNGDLDEIRIWNTARTPQQINNFMYKCPSGEAGLELHYQMDDGTGSGTITDQSGNGYDGTLKNMDPATDWITTGPRILDCCESARVVATATVDPVDGTGLVGTGASRCGPGTVDLTAAGSTGFYNWYDAAAGGNLVGSGTPFTTPSVSATTNFYLVAKDNTSVTNALLFDGTDDYVAIDNFFYTGTGYTELTVEAWVNTTDGTDQVIASFDRSEFWRLEINGDGGGTGQIGFDINTNSGTLDFGSVTRVDDGNWHHVAAVYDNGAVSIYIDGLLDASTTFGTSFGAGTTRYGFLGTGSESAVFNGATGPNNYFNGRMDGFRVWSQARTQAEIQLTMNECLEGTETGLVIDYNMDDMTGTTVTDKTGSNNGLLVNFANPDNSWVNTGPSVTGCCETARTAVTATVIPLPVVDLGPDVCAQGSTTLDAGAGFVGYLWSTTESTQTINVSTAGFYWVEVTDATTCTNRDTVQVAVVNDPTGTTGGQTCNPGSASLSATGSGKGFFYWYDAAAGGSLVGTGSPYATPVLTSTTTYYAAEYDTLTTRDALDFDGVNDFVALDYFYNTNGIFTGLTVEAYVRTTVNGVGQSDNWAIIDFDRSEYFNLFVTGDNGRLGFGTTDNFGVTNDLFSTPPDQVNDGNWHHVVGVYDGTDKILYIDGVEVNRAVNAHAGRPIGTGVTRYGFIGDGSEAPTFNGARNNLYFQGQVDEIRVWNVVRSPAEITNTISECLDGTESGLELYYRMSDGTGSSTLTDHSYNGGEGTLTNMNTATVWLSDGPEITGCGNCISTGRVAAIATVNNPPTDIDVIVSCAGSAGNQVTLLGVGGSGNYDYRETGGAFNYDAVYDATRQSFTVTNGGSYDFEVMDDNGCIFLEATVAVPAAPTTIVSATDAGSCVSQGANDYLFIVNGSNEAMVGINDQGTALGTLNVDTYIDAGPGIFNGDAYMARHFRITSTNAVGGSGALVRLYFTNTEFTDLQTTASGTSTTDDDVSAIGDLGTTKYEGPTEDNVFDDTDATSLVFINQDANGSEFGADYIEVTTSSFSEFWIHASASMTPLPIDLLFFNVEETPEGGLLTWATATEINNDFFTIEKSVDGRNYWELVKIDGAGNSDERLTYSFLDMNLLPGNNYYRLSQTDFDGTRSYFESILLPREGSSDPLLYPNPANLTIQPTLNYHAGASHPIEVMILNTRGELVRRFRTEVERGTNAVDLPSQGLAAGIYLIRVAGQQGVITLRIVLRK